MSVTKRKASNTDTVIQEITGEKLEQRLPKAVYASRFVRASLQLGPCYVVVVRLPDTLPCPILVGRIIPEGNSQMFSPPPLPASL